MWKFAFALATFLAITVAHSTAVLVFDHLTDVKGNNAIKEIRIMYTDEETPPINLTRGIPLFAEIDFVPRFFQTNIVAIVISVLIPENIRRTPLGGPWVIGWNQERFPPPQCPLCTNREQSYTIPVTIFLPDDGWCAVGRIPTGWKIEAVQRDSMPQFSNSDRTIAMVIDEQAHLRVANRPESMICRPPYEQINYEPPSDDEPEGTTEPPGHAPPLGNHHRPSRPLTRYHYNTKFARFAAYFSTNSTNSPSL